MGKKILVLVIEITKTNIITFKLVKEKEASLLHVD